jgi:hypothetical protein
MISAADLHVIAVVSNPVRYRSRVRLFRDFIPRIEASGATLWVVEATFGEREPSVVDAGNPRHIRVRCDSELWLKENLINVGARHAPPDAKYIGWVDGDVAFQRDDWASEVVEYLQHYDVVQPFSHVIDYGPQGEVMQTHKGFAYCHRQGARLGPGNRLGGHRYGGPYWHPGYAWFWRMDAWNAVGGMIDRAVMGAGDHHMACALIGQGEQSYPGGVHRNYKDMVLGWQARAEAAVKGNIGYLPGTIHHHFHGHKADRRYVQRWDILTGNAYDPQRDVALDRHGVLQWATDKRRLIDQARDYFRARNEDAA